MVEGENMATIQLDKGEDWLERYRKEKAKPPFWRKIKPWQWVLIGALLVLLAIYGIGPYVADLEVNPLEWFTVQI